MWVQVRTRTFVELYTKTADVNRRMIRRARNGVWLSFTTSCSNNSMLTHEGDMAFSERQQEFGYAKHRSLPQYCKVCPYLTLC